MRVGMTTIYTVRKTWSNNRLELQCNKPWEGTIEWKQSLKGNGKKTRKCIINGAEDEVNQALVKTSLVTVTSVAERAALLNLEQVFEKALPIKGIAQFHFTDPNDARFNTRRFSTEVVTPATDDAEDYTNDAMLIFFYSL